MMLNFFMTVFVYVPAVLFYLLVIGLYTRKKAGEKKSDERHEADGK